jgi:hypothetical protein
VSSRDEIEVLKKDSNWIVKSNWIKLNWIESNWIEPNWILRLREAWTSKAPSYTMYRETSKLKFRIQSVRKNGRFRFSREIDDSDSDSFSVLRIVSPAWIQHNR